MELEKVILSNFRNYEREEITFSKSLNCIQGDNAEGKSNLLEAIYLISTGKSFRTHTLANLIKYDQMGFQIEAFFSKEGISHSLDISYSPKGRKVLYNQTSYASFLPLLGILPCVLLAPEDISIIIGAPAERRRFLDLHISQMDPQYIHHLGRYHKAMKQRNALLKKQIEKGLDPWEQIMALSASYLIEKREKALLNLKETVTRTISLLSETKEDFSWKYDNTLKVSSPTRILEEWKKNRKKELLLGSTLTGPHRDDLLLYIQGQEIKTFCSEGQKRSCMAALRLAQWQEYKSFFEFSPLFAVDDFGVHLDLKRSLFLNEILKDLGQVFVTAPSFPSKENSYSLKISKGSITK
jgi:DNA replication and repair protein RecF